MVALDDRMVEIKIIKYEIIIKILIPNSTLELIQEYFLYFFQL